MRIVRELRLTAESHAAARTAVATLREAFRLASFEPVGRPGRLVVQRLELGELAEDVSPGSLSLELVRRVRALRADAVHVSAPRAAASRAVWYRDATDASLALIERIARAAPLDAWFWPSMIQGLRAGQGPESALRLAVRQLVDTAPASVRALSLALDRLVVAGRAPLLLDALSASEARVLAGDLVAPPHVEPAAGGAPRRTAPAHWQPVLRKYLARWGVDDPRSTFLCACAVRVACPSLAPSAVGRLGAQLARAVERREAPAPKTQAPTLVAHPGVLPGSLAARRVSVLEPAHGTSFTSAASRAPSSSDASPARAEPPSSPMASEPLSSPRVARQPAGVERAPPATVPPSGTAGAIGTNTLPPARTEASPGAPEPVRSFAGDEHTAYGGLLFVVAALERLGLSDFVATQLADAPEFPWLLLQRVLRALHAREDDALCVLLERIVGGYEAFAPEGSGVDKRAREELDTWERALCSELERCCEVPLAELVVRDARLVSTRTHIDVVFELAQADVRIRRAALDVDPGYVSWLGYVVSFHFV